MSAPSPARQSFLSKAASTVASRPNIALAVIVVLTIVVIALFVYYRGIFSFGPYNKPPLGGERLRDGSPGVAGAASGGKVSAPSAGDAETERLIETINGAPG